MFNESSASHTQAWIGILLGATIALLSVQMAMAEPCPNNHWQPTFVYDTRQPNELFYVMPGLNFTPLMGSTASQWQADACHLIETHGLRDRHHYFGCEDYRKLTCGCDISNLSKNKTCKAFLSKKER